MNARSLFKLVAYIINWIKISVFAFPFSMALIALKMTEVTTVLDENGVVVDRKFNVEWILKYGYDFFTVDYNWAIVIALGFGLILNTWHALSFEDLNASDLKQYLKVRQRYVITGSENWSQKDVNQYVSELVKSNKYWTRVKLDQKDIWLNVKNKFGFRDVVNLQSSPNGFIVESKPKYKIDFVDMARNLENTQFLSKYLKEANRS